MRKLQLVNSSLLGFASILLLILTLLIACNQNKSIPFPETALPQPKTVPLQFSEEKKIGWTEISRDSIQKPVAQSFDIKKLPENKFVINDFKSFTSPPHAKNLNWNHIPDSTINLDTITPQFLEFKKNILPKPVISRAAMPKLASNSSSGLMQFSEEEGLPGTNVSASLVDKDGGIWLAIGRKLVRYAGDQLYTWSFMPRNTTADAAVITRMVMDSLGRIWVGTLSDGAYMLDIDHDVFWSHSTPAWVADMLCDHEGNIWIASVNTPLVVFDPETMKAKVIPGPDPDINNTRPISLLEDEDHNIWLGQRNKISIIDSTRKKIKVIGPGQHLDVNEVVELRADSKGDVWVGTFNREFYSISLKANTITKYNLQNGINATLYDITEDKNGRMWISSRDTIYILNKDKSAFKLIPLNARIFQKHKSTAFTDPAGNIWVGTINNGLLIFDANNLLPQHFDKRNGLVDGNVWGTYEEPDGTIWIGTNSGLNLYDPNTTVIKTLSKAQGLHGNDIKTISAINDDEMFVGNIPGFSIINKKKKILANYGKVQGFPFAVFGTATDSKGNLWIASVPELMVYNRDSLQLKKLETVGGLIGTVCYGIMKDRKNNFWVATDSGVMVINPGNNTLKYLREKEGLAGGMVMKVVERKSGEIWIATDGGISIVDQEKNTITNITGKEGLVPQDIYDLLEKDDRMYAGSSSGLFEIVMPDSSKGKDSPANRLWLRNYNKKEGFPFNDYNQMAGMVRRNGEIWFGITPVLTVLTETNNRLDSTPAQVAIAGISALDHPLLFDARTAPLPDLALSDSAKKGAKEIVASGNSDQAEFLSKNRIRYDSASSIFRLPRGLSLPHNQNSLNFNFSNPSMTGRDKIVYRYILEGEDDQWSAPSPRPFTRNYYNLKPGHYTFKVASKGFTGIWSEPASMQFTIRPPWWLTWWAFTLYAFVFAGAAWIVAGYRSRRLKRENQVLEEKVVHRTAQLNKSLEDLKLTQSQLVQSEKMASLGELTAGIAHEIQNPLNFINNFSDVSMEMLGEMETELDNGNNDEAKLIANDVKSNLEKVIHHGKRADSIVKGMLQHSRGNTGVKEPVDLNAMAEEYLRLSYQGLRAKDKSFNTHFETHFDPVVGTVQVVPQDIGRVLLNIYNNAFYAVYDKKRTALNGYTPMVQVSTRKKRNVIEISVKDNGNGIPDKVADKIFQPFFTTKPTGQGTGLGLSLSYDIVKAHGGEIVVKSEEKEGTEFIITLSYQA